MVLLSSFLLMGCFRFGLSNTKVKGRLDPSSFRELFRIMKGEILTRQEQDIGSKYPAIIYKELVPLLRTQPGELDAYLATVECNVPVPDTKTKAHCHFICLDGNQRPRVKDFARFVGHKVTDFAIPRSEIDRALAEAIKTRSTAPIAKINSRARNLFTNLPNSGEGGEVLLSLLAESVLGLPQLFSKMVLKTSDKMHVHGCDGIHVGVNEINGNLALYWGESKLHSDAAGAARECFASMAPFLLDAGGSVATQERDLQLMRDGIDLTDQGLADALKRYLDPDDPSFKKMEYRGLCLIGFDSEAYPTSPNSKEMAQLKSEIEEVFDARKMHIQKRVVEEKIDSFSIEVFCLPFPKVVDFRDAFMAELGVG